MNVHHLELFYYVAKHGGISPAVRHMPYGIQQPAVSGQILQLEADLGLKLFNRRPFALTPPGERLYAFIASFFANLNDVRAELRGEAGARLRLAASASTLRGHVPDLLHQLRKRFPEVRPCLIEAGQALAEHLLQKQEIDLAITELDGRLAPGLRSLILLQLPLILLAPKSMGFQSAADLLSRESMEHPLISFPETAALTKLFYSHLRRLGCSWPVTMEVSSLDLAETFAAEGFGIGLSVAIPGASAHPGLRSLALPECPPLAIAALWQGKLSPLAAAFLELVKTRAARLTVKPSGRGDH